MNNHEASRFSHIQPNYYFSFILVWSSGKKTDKAKKGAKSFRKRDIKYSNRTYSIRNTIYVNQTAPKILVFDICSSCYISRDTQLKVYIDITIATK